ncbi:MAG: hypothetical protein KJZ83_10190 [Burkholderiaceae bacterium]|nr:hypothetical protein [Burkholderiaceae bacterium]
MPCIYCGTIENMARSHVISKFIRNGITGIADNSGKNKYKFTWIGRKDLPNQDLPKPSLLCQYHDSKFGEMIESPAARILLPSNTQFHKLNEVPKGWVKKVLSINSESLRSITVAEYHTSDFSADDAIRKFAVLTAWRALHAMNMEKNPAVVAFLQSPAGQQVQQDTKNFLDLEKSTFNHTYPYFGSIYLTGPLHASFITRSEDEVPFAWAYLEGHGQVGIVVLLGFWVVIWPLLPDGHPNRDFRTLRQMAFVDWHSFLLKQYSSNKI